MITINNKTLGWAIIIIIILIPWMLALNGSPVEQSNGEATALGMIIGLQITVIGLFILGFLVHTMCRLFDPNHDDAIEFEWKIKLPKFGHKESLHINKDTSDLLRQLAHVDKNSKEYDVIWNKLNKRKVFG